MTHATPSGDLSPRLTEVVLEPAEAGVNVEIPRQYQPTSAVDHIAGNTPVDANARMVGDWLDELPLRPWD